MTKRRTAWPLILLLVGPALLMFTFFVVVPVIQAAVFSLYKWNGLGPLTDFRGLDNFASLFQNPVFHQALTHNLAIVFFTLILQIPLALYLALMIGRAKFKLAVLFRTIFFLPYVFSEVISGLLWQYIYHPQRGLFHAFYTNFLPNQEVPAVLGSPDTVLMGIMVVIMWKYFGFHMSILIAGLQDIPEELKEAARIDGASESQTTQKIILPLLLPTILISVFFGIVGSFQVFDVIWAMGKGDPVNAAESVVTYLYKFGIQRFNIGYGSAVAVTIFLICLAFSLWYNRILARVERR